MSAKVQKSRVLDAPGRVAHGFSTRHGGVSTGSRASLDLNDPDDIVRAENWQRLLADVGVPGPERVAWLQQVHGDGIVRVSEPGGPLEPVAEGDALFTTDPGVVLAVRTADCVPVLISGPGVVAAAHSGWRGTAVDIVGKLVDALVQTVGVPPGELVAAVGPANGGAHYEVGPEVDGGLASTGLPPEAYGHAPSPRHPETRFVVDLKAAVAAQLARRGVEQIDVSGTCTFADHAFYSVRRDGSDTGRQVGLIARLESA